MPRTYVPNEESVPGYRLVEFLGRGGFGEVWKATGPGGTQVALKMIDITGREGQKELNALRMVKRIRHPNLTPITAFWLRDDQGHLFDDGDVTANAKTTEEETAYFEVRQPVEMILAMGLGDKNLLDRLKECRKLGMAGIPPDELLEYLEDSAKAIDHLNSATHDFGAGPVAIQHCDIKPQNIMIVSGSAQVCDFGLARAMGDVRASVAAGSPAYAAPECIQDNQPSKSTDQYSLAISYVELRTGRLPFEEVSFMAVLKAHMLGELDLSLLPEAERAVIKKATSRDPSRRYPSNVGFVRDLRKAVRGELRAADVDVPPQGLTDTQTWAGGMPAHDTASLADAATKVWDGTSLHAQATQPLPGVTVTTRTVEEEPPPAKQPIALYAAGGVLLLLALAAPFVLSGLRTGTYRLELPEVVELQAGERRDVFIGLAREGLSGPVTLELTGAPSGVTIDLPRNEADERGWQLGLAAGLDAVAGEHELQASVAAGQQKSAEKLKVKIIAAKAWLPQGYAAAPGAKVVSVQNVPRYDRLVHSATGVVFLLMPKVGRDDPEPFYITENKITNAVFAAFAQAEKLAEGTQWKLGAIASGKDVGSENGKLPAFRMTVDEAHRCAVWLGGRLPSCSEWERAAGFDRSKAPAPGAGPFRLVTDQPTKGAIAVDRAADGPQEAGVATLDISPTNCRDMAGNGAEWTRDLAGVERLTVPVAQPTEDHFVFLRGRSYQHPKPLTYADLAAPDLAQTEVQPYQQPRPDVSFRVVLELPAQ